MQHNCVSQSINSFCSFLIVHIYIELAFTAFSSYSQATCLFYVIIFQVTRQGKNDFCLLLCIFLHAHFCKNIKMF